MYDEAVQHYDDLKRIAYSRCDSKEEAEDVLQQTYCKALENWDTYENGTNCKAWLRTILRNTHINKIRKTEKVHLQDDPDHGKYSKAHFLSAEELPSEQFDGIDPKIEKALQALPKKYRSVLLLRGLHDLKYKEISYVLSVPVGTVMSRLYRARRIIRDQISQDGGI